jgi:hypothetical protein
MDCYQIFEPLHTQIEGVHYDQSPYLGSEQSNANAVYGYMVETKPRWTNVTREFNDLAAMERHGIDPTRPVPAGVIVMADPYGFAVDGFTTGYTTKLPPPADPVAAQNTPKSFNVMSVVERGNGGGTTSGIGNDEPVNSPSYAYGTDPEVAGGRTQAAGRSAAQKAALVTALVRESRGSLSKSTVEQLLR